MFWCHTMQEKSDCVVAYQKLWSHVQGVLAKIVLATTRRPVYCTMTEQHLQDVAGSKVFSPESLSRQSRMLSVNLLSSVKSAGRQWQNCSSCCLVANTKQTAQCWSESTGPTCVKFLNPRYLHLPRVMFLYIFPMYVLILVQINTDWFWSLKKIPF